MTGFRQFPISEMIFRAFCMGIALLVVVPMLGYIAALPLMHVIGICEPDAPVLCEFAASDFALLGALPAFACGVGMSVWLDRRQPAAGI
ncbi:hypothetical protein [Roseinatronobacter alkalisoli]|uniref:Uncharacterized protein n=1 Tax=Roseinatronobacter alkalisoli TaxID=3028235 RepID=A0ABT5T790_9RHOB|nr:hypothetical protein [Roseinatronobacter sp. HJB301]MDD7970914.1 hypothetical protein [Roseinatronobacter sp. HJB301]